METDNKGLIDKRTGNAEWSKWASELLEKVMASVGEINKDPAKMKKYLNMQSRMPDMNAANIILLLLQYPKATEVKERAEWSRTGRKVKRGEKGVNIIKKKKYHRPGDGYGDIYISVCVFDISQTNARRKPAPTLDMDPEDQVKKMIKNSIFSVELTDEDKATCMSAFYDNDRNTIFVERGSGNSVKVFQSMAQELGFAYLSTMNESYSRMELAYEAMCIGYMVCRYFTVDETIFSLSRLNGTFREYDGKKLYAELVKMQEALYSICKSIEGDPSGGKERDEKKSKKKRAKEC